MARMLPPQVFERTVSRAERRLFLKIKKDLGDQWTVLHSLGFTGHRVKPWAEIDFLLIGPPGVYCLEVKGGRIRREGGVWIYTDRNGRSTEKREGPFDQVSPATAVVRNHIVGQLPEAGRAPIGYGVVTPDIEWTIDGLDTPKELVYDADDAASPFGRYVDRIVRYWQQWLRDRGRPITGLDEKTRSAVVDLLRGDFDLRPTLAAQLGLVNEELLRLTEQQSRTVHGLTQNDRALIRGGAGTGKTLLALDEARREAEAGRRVLLTCFNRRLADLMNHALRDLEYVTVRHLHGLMSDLVRRAELEQRLPDADDASLFDVHYPGLAAEALIELDEIGSFDVLVVDEAQDLLLGSYMDLLDWLIKGGLAEGRWRIFLDHKQNLYRADEPAALVRLEGYDSARFELTVNCRNTAAIGVATSLFAATPLDEFLEVEGPSVEPRWYNESRCQAGLLQSVLNELLIEGIDLRQVVVLSRRRRENSDLPRTLSDDTRLWEADEPRPRRRHVEFSTVASFKGLERDVVIVTGIDDLKGQDARLSLYVGLSRAKALLIPFVSESQRQEYEQLSKMLGQRIAAQPASALS